jgi:hypothetical protein
MTATDQKEAVRRFMGALESRGSLDVLDEICTPAIAEEWRATMEDFAFTDRTFTVDQIVAEGSQVAILWSINATHTGEYAHLAPTGKHTSNTGSGFFTFEEGRIADVVSHYDADGLYDQLGAAVRPADSPGTRPPAGV